MTRLQKRGPQGERVQFLPHDKARRVRRRVSHLHRKMSRHIWLIELPRKLIAYHPYKPKRGEVYIRANITAPSTSTFSLIASLEAAR